MEYSVATCCVHANPLLAIFYLLIIGVCMERTVMLQFHTPLLPHPSHRDVMGLLPLGLHTLLMIIVMPVYLYFMCTQSFVAMRFVWARWLVGGMFAGFSVGSVAMPVLGCWPLPLSMQLACVGGCWALQGAATTAAMLRLRAVEKSARRDFAALVEQRM